MSTKIDECIDFLVNSEIWEDEETKESARLYLKRKWEKCKQIYQEDINPLSQWMLPLEWKQKYPILQDVDIEFEQYGALQNSNYSRYCHCPRGEQCCEFQTQYHCSLIMKTKQKIIFKLQYNVDQDVDTGDDKVSFGDPEEQCNDQYINWDFWTWDNLEPLFQDFVTSFCTYPSILLKNTQE